MTSILFQEYGSWGGPPGPSHRGAAILAILVIAAFPVWSQAPVGGVARGVAGGVAQVREAERERARGAEERAREALEGRRAEQGRAREALERRRAELTKEHTRSDASYQRGMRALDERQWDRAVELFGEIAKAGTSRADGAVYWKAYAQNKLGQRTEALATLQELAKTFPNSGWLNDAKALEAEVRQASGQPVAPETETDEELKLYALNSLANTDPERAVPLLEKIIQGSYAPKLKERALFVLSQSGSPKAREILGQVARGKSNPDIQLKAIQYLGVMGKKENRQMLSEIYGSSSDANVKRAILRSFMAAGDRDHLLAAAKSEQVPELRREAIRLLGASGAQSELWQLYGSESSVEIKRAILQGLFTGGSSDRLTEVARSEKDPALRREAVRMLGLMRSSRTADVLSSIYASDSDLSIRKEILNALFIQGNAKALIDLGRKETDPSLKREIVQKLSVMKSKEATDFMLEILNK